MNTRIEQIKTNSICYCGKTDNDNKSKWMCKRCGKELHKECINYKRKEFKREICITCMILQQNPFEEIYDNLIKINPFILPSNSKKNNILKFELNNESIRRFKNFGLDKIYIHSFNLKSEKNQIEWPSNKIFKIYVNKIPIVTEDKKPSCISNYLEEKNEIEFEYDKMDNKMYLILIYAMKTKYVENIKLELSFTLNECKIKFLKNFPEYIKEEEVSMRCPYSQQIMKCPVKGINCSHIKCYEFSNYLRCPKRNFKCPICKKTTYLSDLYEDLWIKKIITDFCNEYKNEIDDYLVYINSEGQWRANKINYDKEFSSYANFDNQMIALIEKMNYSPERNERINLISDNGNDENKISSDYFNELIAYCKAQQGNLTDVFNFFIQNQSLINKFSYLNLNDFSKIIMLIAKPLKRDLIFPFDISLYTHMNFFKIAEMIISKYHRFFQVTSLWKKNEADLIELIFYINNHKEPYFAMELIIGLAYFIYRPNQSTIHLEFLLGSLIGMFSGHQNYSEIETAYLIEMMTNLFPDLYIPNKIFESEVEKSSYFEKMIRFYFGLLKYFEVDYNAKIFKLLFQNISEEIHTLPKELIFFIEDFEICLISPLLNKLGYTIKDKATFLKYYDSLGHFRNFLEIKNKLNEYGWKKIINCSDVIQVGNMKSIISQYYEIQ